MSDQLFFPRTDNRPMYLQVLEQIKLNFMAGDWPEGLATISRKEQISS